MKRKVTAGLVLVAGLTGCLETTEPTVRVETRIAHLAPGTGTYAVTIDGGLLVESIAPLQYAFLPVDADTHTYTFEHTQDATEYTAVADSVADITGVVLINPADPELRTFPLSRTSVTEQRIVVVNGDSAATDLTIQLISGDTTTVTLAPGEAETVTPEVGTYDLQVHQGDIANAVELDGFTLRTGDHGFLVIYPPASETERFGRFLF